MYQLPRVETVRAFETRTESVFVCQQINAAKMEDLISKSKKGKAGIRSQVKSKKSGNSEVDLDDPFDRILYMVDLFIPSLFLSRPCRYLSPFLPPCGQRPFLLANFATPSPPLLSRHRNALVKRHYTADC